MALMEQWRKTAYDETLGKPALQKLWNEYFMKERDIYAELLKNPDEVVTGTVKELAEKYGVDIMTMTGFLDGINDSLKEANPLDELEEDTVMMDALEAGAADFEADGTVLEITTDPDAFNDVVKALEEKGYSFVSAQIEMVPQNYIVMTSEDDVRSMTKLLDMLDDNEDVQNVWHNWQQD